MDFFDKLRELHSQGIGFCFYYQYGTEFPYYSICIKPLNKKTKEIYKHEFELSDLEPVLDLFLGGEEEEESDESLL